MLFLDAVICGEKCTRIENDHNIKDFLKSSFSREALLLT